MSPDKQDQLIKLRCSKLQKDIIQANAAAAEMKTSSYLRELGLKGTSIISRGLYQAAQATGAKLQLNIQANELLQYLHELIQKISAEDLIQPEGRQLLEHFSISLLEARRKLTFEGADCKQVYRDLNQAVHQFTHPDLVDIKGQFNAHQSHKR